MRRLLLPGATLLLVACLATSVFAGNAWGLYKKCNFSIGIGNDLGTATFTPDKDGWNSESYVGDDGKTYYVFNYTLAAPVEYYVPGHEGDENYLIAAIDQLSMEMDQDPYIDIAFVVRAGSGTTPTTFNFTNWIDPLSLTNAIAHATASITATDRNLNGVTVVGLFPGNKLYKATYNSGSLFAYLVDGGSAVPPNSYSDNEDTGTAFTSLGSVTRIEAAYSFTLTPRDSASATSFYEIYGDVIPEPSSFMVLAGGLFLGIGSFVRRRRS